MRMPAYGKLIYRLATESGLTVGEKGALFLALGYQVSPVDLVPGFIPIIGQLDDLQVMFWGIRRTLEKLPTERVDDVLAYAGLTQAQLDADAAVIQRALSDVLARGSHAAGRGARALLHGGVSAAAYLGYLAYYLFRPKK